MGAIWYRLSCGEDHDQVQTSRIGDASAGVDRARACTVCARGAQTDCRWRWQAAACAGDAFEDLHAAPGGQTGANIDDSAGYPWLYDSPQEQEHLMAIWRRLATHYRDEPMVLGYDLLNEPIPHFPKLAALNPALEPLYKKLAGEIRKIDAHHILFLGGAQWDGDFSAFGKPFDGNTAYTFHKY